MDNFYLEFAVPPNNDPPHVSQRVVEYKQRESVEDGTEELHNRENHPETSGGGVELLAGTHRRGKKRRLWLADGSCVRLRPEHRNHVWSYDFVEDKTTDGRKIRILNIIDEHTPRECLASVPRRSWNSGQVIELLADLMLVRGTPEYLRSDNGSEFTAQKIREWLQRAGVTTAYIEPGSPWGNGYCESFNSRMRDEFLNGESFDTLAEAVVLIHRWVKYYNEVRPHSSLGGRPPAPQCVIR